MRMAERFSQWYPYTKVQESYYDLADTVSLPRKICDYLIDAPIIDRVNGSYFPPNDNKFARCRLWKYLYYDGATPLNEPLPTIEQKMSVLFNPSSPENPPTSKGYRLIPQIYVKPSQVEAQSRIHIYMGRTVPSQDEFKIAVSVVFYIWTHYTYELNTKSDEYSRAFAIEQALIEAFHGVNMEGIGTFFFSRIKHPDCGSRAIFDGETNVGRELTMALEIATTNDADLNSFENKPIIVPNGKIRLA